MSKQYLTTHTLDDAHKTDIFSLAVTPNHLLSASGCSSILIHSTTSPSFPLHQTLEGAHKLGCHHICTSRNGFFAASVGFGGDVKIWALDQSTGNWREDVQLQPEDKKAGEIWAVAMNLDGSMLIATTSDGKINVWDLVADGGPKRIRTWETKGSFGLSVDISRDGRWVVSGHEDGGIFVYDNAVQRLVYTLTGLVKPIRSVAFSPGGSRIAAAGDAGVIALYDVKHGEQVANLSGHAAWIFSLDWSDTGEYLLSGSFDGKVKVWSVENSTCVATHSETDQTLWTVKWLPKTGRSEAFATAGQNRSISFYREATGG